MKVVKISFDRVSCLILQVEALLQYKADPFIEQKDGKSPLDVAAEFGRLRVVELLLSTFQSLIHLDVQSGKLSKQHTPLHLAAKNGHSDVARYVHSHDRLVW